MPEGAAAPFEARYSILKLTGWTLLAAPLALGAVWMLRASLAQGSLFGIMIGGAGIAFFGGAILGFLRCLVDRRVQLRIDGKGLFLRPHADKPIPLRSIRAYELANNMVRLRLYKPSKFPISSRLRRFIYRINGASAREYFGDAWVWTTHYDCTWEDIDAAINAHTAPTDFERDLAVRSRAGS